MITADGIADTVLVLRLGDVAIASRDDEEIGLFDTGSLATFTVETTGTSTVEAVPTDQVERDGLIEVTIGSSPYSLPKPCLGHGLCGAVSVLGWVEGCDCEPSHIAGLTAQHLLVQIAGYF